MIKTITKVTACSIIAALLVTAYPAKEVKALTLPAAGLAATTGVGNSLKDIKASKARAKATMNSLRSCFWGLGLPTRLLCHKHQNCVAMNDFVATE